ncbi:hypothetical protein [Halorussus caseinilyticus]|uniref:PGF-pre-PGF domain-containing protein n=1 Tax=Halorussus caseinilyticus TaxID=3034025 RepID=A0ABD5WLA3_9EURY
MGSAHSVTTSPLSTSFSSSGNHSLAVGSLASTDVTVRDETPPTAPDAVSVPEWVNDTAPVSWSGVTDNGIIDHYEMQVDDGPWQSVGNDAETINLTNGTHEISVRAVDTGGNVGPATNATTHADTIPPSAPNVSVPEGWTDGDVTVSWSNVTDGESGLDSYEFRADGQAWSYPTIQTSGEFDFNTSGNHTVSVRGIDAVDNRGPATNETVRVDAMGPNLTIESRSVNYTDKPVVFVNVTDVRSGVVPSDVNVTVDNQNVTNYSVVGDSVVYRKNVSHGLHTVKVTSTDGVGNTAWSLYTVATGGDGSGGNSGGGGGGGGGSVPPPPVLVEVVEQTDDSLRAEVTGVRADAAADVSLSGLGNERVAFQKVSVTPGTDDAGPRFSIEATSVDDSGVAPLPADETLGVLRVEPTNVESDQFTRSKVRFRVPTGGVSPEEVTAYRYRDGEWQALETEFVGEREGPTPSARSRMGSRCSASA